MRAGLRGIVLLSLVLSGASTFSQQPVSNDQFVSKEEYQKLKTAHEKLQQDMEALKAQVQELMKKPGGPEAPNLKAQVDDLQKKSATQQTETDQALDDMDKELKNVKALAKASFPGSTKMLLAGYGSGTFMATTHGYGPSQPIPETAAVPRDGRSFFTATFNPFLLWKLSDRLLFEGELELELQSAEPTTTTALEMAQISYLLNDYMTIGAGKFLNPMDYFVERQHMGWVNKLPDKPLAVYDGLLPESLLGIQVRGGIPIGPAKLGYAFYVANAPTLTTTAGDPTHPVDLGTLNYEDFDNSFNHVAVGGRVGFYPLPELEIGYGFQTSGVGPKGSDVGSLLQSADLTYVRDSEALKGTVNLHAQWVWSHLDRFNYDATAPFSNNRDGGYVQVAYRPARVQNPILRNFESVLRYDMINQKKTPVGFDERRWTLGLNYWLGPSMVAKAAYEFDHQNGQGQSGDAFLLQFVVGF